MFFSWGPHQVLSKSPTNLYYILQKHLLFLKRPWNPDFIFEPNIFLNQGHHHHHHHHPHHHHHHFISWTIVVSFFTGETSSFNFHSPKIILKQFETFINASRFEWHMQIRWYFHYLRTKFSESGCVRKWWFWWCSRMRIRLGLKGEIWVTIWCFHMLSILWLAEILIIVDILEATG